MRVDRVGDQCNKFTYTSPNEAKEVIRKCKSASSRSKIPKRVYFCKECKGYHVTSQKNKSKFQ